MQCEEIRKNLPDYLIENVGELSLRSIEEHLGACTSCRDEIESLKALWSSLENVPAAVPGPEVAARFDAMLEAYEDGRKSVGWWPLRSPVLQLSFGLLLLLLGVFAGYEFGRTQSIGSKTEIAELRNELRETRQMVALSMLQQPSATGRLQGINWSYQVQQPGREMLTALLDTLTHDPNVNVRLAAVDALGRFANQAFVRSGIVDAVTQKNSPMVQIALIDLLVQWREQSSAQALRSLIETKDLNDAVRKRAQAGVAELGAQYR